MIKLYLKLIKNVTATMTDWVSTFLPLAVLFGNFVVASFGPWLTFLTLILMPITLNVTKRHFNIKDSSPFYFSYTLYSMLVCYLTFESVTHLHYAAITRTEYFISLSLFGASLCGIILTRIQSASVAPTHVEAGKPAGNYDFCKKCRKTVPGRDHHCVWLNTCIGQGNKGAFISTIFFAMCWLFYTIMINLSSMCNPVFMFNGWGFNDGTSTAARWFLVPMQCPQVYEKGQYMITLCFVISIYSLGVSLLLTLVLIHQIRLRCLGVSYLEYKFGSKKKSHSRTSSNSSQQHEHED